MDFNGNVKIVIYYLINLLYYRKKLLRKALIMSPIITNQFYLYPVKV